MCIVASPVKICLNCVIINLPPDFERYDTEGKIERRIKLLEKEEEDVRSYRMTSTREY